MKYAIHVLEKDKLHIDECLKKGDWSKYPEARKRQENKGREIDEAIKKLKES